MAGTKGIPVMDIGIKKKIPISNPATTTKGAPEELLASNNLTKKQAGDPANLNFKVPPEFKREFCIDAIELDITQVELLYRIHKFWKDRK